MNHIEVAQCITDLEAEVERLNQKLAGQYNYKAALEQAEARLAAVVALCGRSHGTTLRVADVLAAAKAKRAV